MIGIKTVAQKEKKAPAGKKTAEVTPMMAQFLKIKAENADCLLFYRMGDFYELFFDDAVAAASALDITLTKRGRHLGQDIPMCGVPVHAADTYLARLIRKGFRVAVCEQVEDPAEARKRGPKAVVKRQVTRLITPGTLTEDTLLDARRHNFLAALGQAEGKLSLALVDMSTGDFSVMPASPDTLDGELTRFNPGEILIAKAFLEGDENARLLSPWADRMMPLESTFFDSLEGENLLKAIYGVKVLDGFGTFSRSDLAAAGALLGYLKETQKGLMPALKPIKKLDPGAAMIIDMATRKNLELTRTLSGESKGSLVQVIDRTVTGAGSRLLTSRLLGPLTSVKAIHARHESVAFFNGNEFLCEKIRKILRSTPDLERALSRLSLDRGAPKDLGAIRDGLKGAMDIRALFDLPGKPLEENLPREIEAALSALKGHETLVQELTRSLKADLPLLKRDGGFVAKGYNAALDEFRTLRDESRRLITALEGRYRKETGVPNLKIKHNNIIGFHIDVAARHGEKFLAAPLNETFIHRQTMASSVRFSTPDLSDLAGKISQAADKATALELQIFEDLAKKVLANSAEISKAAEALAALDVSAALSILAIEAGYVRPAVDDSLAFEVAEGRHPVVEKALQQAGDIPFVANACDLGAGHSLWLVTGPNMAGKSTFLRQNALIAILAQMGSFVPAASAHIGVVDRLFSRVGASDNLAQGRSTFMVEMVETAAILNQAGEKSLVILDEIGRGTATYDGLSIAWAAIEHLHEVNKSRTLFATHYHELTALHARLENISLHTMRVKEWKGDLVFLHEVAPGAADRSYGIQVAKLAGLPVAVVERAFQVLESLEAAREEGGQGKAIEDLPLFQKAARSPPRGSSPDALIAEALEKTNPDELSPKEALEQLYSLRRLLKKKDS